MTFPLDDLKRNAGILEEIEDAFTLRPPVEALFLEGVFLSLVEGVVSLILILLMPPVLLLVLTADGVLDEMRVVSISDGVGADSCIGEFVCSDEFGVA